MDTISYSSQNKFFRWIIISSIIGTSLPLCVVDNKKGWWLDCGVRDSYLFRIKDFGGVSAHFDFGIGLGDEFGFPHSISNTNKKALPPPEYEQPLPPKIPPYIYSRSGDAAMDGNEPGKHALQKRSSANVMPFPLNYFVPTPPRDESPPEPPRRSHSSRRRSPSKPHSKYRTFVPSKRGEELPEVIPAENNRGVWVRMPLQQERGERKDVSRGNDQGRRSSANIMPFPLNYFVPTPRQSSSEPTRRVYRNEVEATERDRYERRDQYERRESERRVSPEQEYNRRQEFASNRREYQGAARKELPSHFQSFRSPPPLSNPSNIEEEYQGPVIGDVMGEVLQMSPTTPADTAHVPSFAAQVLVVKDAPKSLHPPKYKDPSPYQSMSTRLPRTDFFCEDQDFLPGMYADTQLGCKVFHLCVPAALGSTMVSFLCPNSTLFDQSILQCNYWQLVDCSSSPSHYDANQPLALSYRRVNAAYLPVNGVHDPLTLSLLEDFRKP